MIFDRWFWTRSDQFLHRAPPGVVWNRYRRRVSDAGPFGHGRPRSPEARLWSKRVTRFYKRYRALLRPRYAP